MSNNFPPEYREPCHFLDSDPRIDVREARINFRIGIQDALARERYLQLERLLDSLIKQHPKNAKSKLSDWKQAFFGLIEGPRNEDRYFNLYTTSNFEAIREEVGSLVGENLLAPENSPQAVFAKIPLMSPELLHYSMLENLIKRVLLQVKNDTARESIKTRLNEIFHALYAENDWNFRHRTNWNTIWDEFREIELHWVSCPALRSLRSANTQLQASQVYRTAKAQISALALWEVSLLLTKALPSSQHALQHRRINGRYALANGIETSGDASGGGKRF